jgi:hypothetical protein
MLRNNLMVTIRQEIFKVLRRIAGCRRMSVVAEPPPWPDLEAAYREMAADEAREAEAREWAEALVADIDA